MSIRACVKTKPVDARWWPNRTENSQNVRDFQVQNHRKPAFTRSRMRQMPGQLEIRDVDVTHYVHNAARRGTLKRNSTSVSCRTGAR
jgi:hypothetical protein